MAKNEYGIKIHYVKCIKMKVKQHRSKVVMFYTP